MDFFQQLADSDPPSKWMGGADAERPLTNPLLAKLKMKPEAGKPVEGSHEA